MEYNQIGDTNLKNSCSILAFLDYIKYEYYIEVQYDSIVSFLKYLEKASAWFPKWGADAGVIYPAIQKYIKWKYKLNMQIKVWNIKQINDTKGHVLGFKGANKKYLELTKDYLITKEDIDAMKVSNGHFIYWEDGVMQDNLGGIRVRWTYDLILYAYEKWLFYYNTREFLPWDSQTMRLIEKTKAIGKQRKEDGWKDTFLSITELKNLKLI